MQLTRLYWIGLRVGADEAVNEPLVKPDSLLGVSREIAYSLAPGVPKSLLVLPTAMTSAS